MKMLGKKRITWGKQKGMGSDRKRVWCEQWCPLESLGGRWVEADIYAHQCHCLWQGAITCLQGFMEVAIIVYDLCGSLIPFLTRWTL